MSDYLTRTLGEQNMDIAARSNVNMPASRLLGESIAVLGVTGTGKSNTSAVLAEECLQVGIPITIIDIHGEYFSLKEQYPQANLHIIGKSIEPDAARFIKFAPTHEQLRETAKRAYLNGVSVVFDLSGYDPDMRQVVVKEYLGSMWEQAQAARIPNIIFLEESHNFIPQKGKADTSDLIIRIATEGRKRGLSLIMLGQRSSRINKDALTQAKVVFAHQVIHPADMGVYGDLFPTTMSWLKPVIGALEVGECLILSNGNMAKVKIRLRHSRHIGFTPGMEHIPASNFQSSLFDPNREL